VAIGNPVSGGGRTGRRLDSLVRALEGRGHRVHVRLTREPGDARRLTAELDPDVDRLVVVGGDGTLNEVLNGLRELSAVPLCQLATGTANILAHELCLPRKPRALADLLERGEVRDLDVGRVGDRRFLMVVSAGFDAMVTEEIHRRRTGTLGYTGYLLPITRVLATYRAPKVSVRVDSNPAVSGELVVVSNTRNYGGLFTLADRARVDSGHLDVCVLSRASIAGLLGVTAAALSGGVSGRKGVVYLTGREIVIESTHPVSAQIDGDYFGTTPLSIGLESERVPFVVPS
jgi:diacylglycerol kinase (ATP)